MQKISPPPRLDHRTVQPVVSHYTDWATRPVVGVVNSNKTSEPHKIMDRSNIESLCVCWRIILNWIYIPSLLLRTVDFVYEPSCLWFKASNEAHINTSLGQTFHFLSKELVLCFQSSHYIDLSCAVSRFTLHIISWNRSQWILLWTCFWLLLCRYPGSLNVGARPFVWEILASKRLDPAHSLKWCLREVLRLGLGPFLLLKWLTFVIVFLNPSRDTPDRRL